MENKTKHTPGPWMVLKPGDKRRSDGPNAVLDRIVTARGVVGVADCVPCDSALISAAPDLLAALELVLTSGKLGLSREAVAARAAIAKAKGE